MSDEPDGRFGSNTASAVRFLQASLDLEKTGVVTASLYDVLKELTRRAGIASLSAFESAFNGAELLAGTTQQLRLPEDPQPGEVRCELDEWSSLTLTVDEEMHVTGVVVDGRLDGFAEAEASVMNAMNGALTACSAVTTLQQSRDFLKKVGAYKSALQEEGIGAYSWSGLRYEWVGENGALRLSISIE